MPRPTPPAHSADPVPLTIPAHLAGTRLDRAVADLVTGLSRAQAQRLIAAGQVTVNGAAVKPSLPVQPGDTVLVTGPADTAPTTLEAEAIPLEVVYEDDALLVVNKPAGLVVHPAPGHPAGTLVNALLHHTAGTIAGAGAPERPGIVHRLDRDTSGLLVVAKTAAAHAALAPQFADHTVERAYLALVWGTFAERAGTIPYEIVCSITDRAAMFTKSSTSQIPARLATTVPSALKNANVGNELNPSRGRRSSSFFVGSRVVTCKNGTYCLANSWKSSVRRDPPSIRAHGGHGR